MLRSCDWLQVQVWVCQLAWGFARQGYRRNALLWPRLGGMFLEHVNRAMPQDLANFWWALGKVRQRAVSASYPTGLFTIIYQRFQAQCVELTIRV